MQSAVLPPEFQKMFARMFDDAPQDEWRDVEKVIRKDFGGRGVEEVFGVSFTGEEGKGLSMYIPNSCSLFFSGGVSARFGVVAYFEACMI